MSQTAHLDQRPALTLFSRTAKPILTQSGELVVHLAGRPGDDGFVQSLQSLEREMDLASPFVSAEQWAKRTKDGRGNHAAVSVGLSLGGGCTVSTSTQCLARCSPFLQRPGRLKISSKKTSQAVDPLIRHPAMKRLAGYAKGEFWPPRFWGPILTASLSHHLLIHPSPLQLHNVLFRETPGRG